MNNLKQLLFLLFFINMTSVTAQVFVDASATGMNDGSSWANAYSDLKAAITGAAPNSELWIAAGVYSPGATTTDRFLLFIDLKLYGGFNGTETALSQRDYQTNLTILSGDVLNDDVPGDFTMNKSDNNLHIIWCHNSITNNTVIDGFIIERGNTKDLSGSGDDRRGGGILAYGSPIIQNCTFRDNYAYFGSGVYPRNAASIDTKIFNCLFENNLSGYGSAVLGAFSEVTMENCIIRNNYSEEGAAVTCNSSSATIRNCEFLSNTGGLFAGAAFFVYQGDFPAPLKILIEDTDFDQNACTDYGGAVGIWDIDVTAEFKRCNFTDNTSVGGGAGIFSAYNASMTITNCTFKNNIAPQGGAIMTQDSSLVSIDSCLFEGNEANGMNSGGGAFVAYAAETTVIKNSVFKDNKANAGGAIFGYLYGGVDYHIDVENTYFTGNEATDDGGAFNLFSTNLSLTNCLVAENTAAIGSAIYANANAVNQSISLTNTTVSGHVGTPVIAQETVNSGGSELVLLNTIIENPGFDNYVELSAGTSAVSNGGNLSSDATLSSSLTNVNDLNNTNANFINAQGGDYHLSNTSPCVNTGMTNGAPLLDLEDNIRFGDPDMGCYEFQGLVNTEAVFIGLNTLDIFPNPVANQLNFTLANDWKGSFEVRVFNMGGSLLLKKELHKTTKQIRQSLNIGNLPAGVYQLNVSRGSILEVKSFIVN